MRKLRNQEDFERKKLMKASIYALMGSLLLFFVYMIAYLAKIDLTRYGIYPRHLEGLRGILFSPFIHDGFSHLWSNIVPFFVLATFLFYFFPRTAIKIILIIWFFSGFWTWISAREAYHIGASNIVYGLWGFLFFSGFIRKNKQLMGISLLVAFLYGGIIWGIFPVRQRMSWEGHLWGLVAGITMAFYFRKSGPEDDYYDWQLEEDDEDEEGKEENKNQFLFHYTYKSDQNDHNPDKNNEN
jgi:membrane associated rhomboid family serine protease